MDTANPVLHSNYLTKVRSLGEKSEVMTINGTVNKSIILFGLLLIAAFYTWRLALSGAGAQVMPLMGLGTLVGLIAALVLMFVPKWGSVLAPIYAIAQGLFLGGLSAFLENRYPGIVIQAVALTLGTMAALLFAYKSKLIVVTDKFKTGVMAATGGLLLVYLVAFILGLFGVSLPFFGNGLFGIGFSLLVVGIAALNLVLDFSNIEEASNNNLPQYFEWFCAFGLMVTLVWLYIEILRLLQIFRSDD